MKDILADDSREVLRRFAGSNVLLALDYDGTLAPIVDQPERAFMRTQTRELLQEATNLFPTVVISGRAQPDSMRRLRGIGVCAIIGNHGLEPRHGTDELIQRTRRWLSVLGPHLAGLRGVHIEDKIFSLAIHYRRSREKKQAHSAIVRATASLGDVRIIGGKQVVNIVPEEAPHKGNALERERDRLRCDTAIYVGDDETDEDVFSLDQPSRLLTIRVGAKADSAAGYFISRQVAMDSLLRALIELRRKPS